MAKIACFSANNIEQIQLGLLTTWQVPSRRRRFQVGTND